jgi:hypothetical protein
MSMLVWMKRGRQEERDFHRAEKVAVQNRVA